MNIPAVFEIADATTARAGLKDVNEYLHRALQIAMRQSLGKRTLEQVLAEKMDIDEAVSAVKDIILPGDIREILNQVGGEPSVAVCEPSDGFGLEGRPERPPQAASLPHIAKLSSHRNDIAALLGYKYNMGPKTKLLPLVLAVGCCPTLFAEPAGPWRGPRVIIIGVDGLSVDGVSTARVPRLRELMARSAWTLEARAVLPTLSSPNWASAINGASPAQHGITSNGYFRHMVEFQPVCRTEDGKFPTIFGLLRAAYPAGRIAVFHDWDGFADLLEKHVPDVLRHVAGAAKTTAAAIAYWTANRPALMFIHLDNVDHTGHAHGWLSKEYYKAVADADGYVGQVLDMVDALSARDSTYILVTSDHGGTKHGHGKNSLAEIQIPWILAGPGVTPAQIAVPVNIFDTALTVAWIFHLDPSECWIGRPVLTAFRPSLVAAHGNADGHAPLTDCAPGRQLTRAALTGQTN